MTKKHFKDIAEIFSKGYDLGTIKVELCHYFETQNPLFNTEKFLEAAEYKG
jgi:hypothetical protein